MAYSEKLNKRTKFKRNDISSIADINILSLSFISEKKVKHFSKGYMDKFTLKTIILKLCNFF